MIIAGEIVAGGIVASGTIRAVVVGGLFLLEERRQRCLHMARTKNGLSAERCSPRGRIRRHLRHVKRTLRMPTLYFM